MAKSVERACLRFTGLFEAELLTELMLRFWNHPRADDPDFRSGLLEAAAAVLKASSESERLFDDLTPQNVNFVAAVWYAESVSIADAGETTEAERELRKRWIDSLVRVLNSIFLNRVFP